MAGLLETFLWPRNGWFDLAGPDDVCQALYFNGREVHWCKLAESWKLGTLSGGTRKPGVGASVVDAVPSSSVHLLPAAVPLEFVPILTCLLSDIPQLFISSPAVQLVTTARPQDETNTDCLAIVTAYMLLYTVPALGRLTNASPCRGWTLWQSLLWEG